MYELFKVLEEDFCYKMLYTRLTWSQFTSSLKRKKVISGSEDTKLAKVLTTLDLTALGIGSTLGVGVYVLAGEVSKTMAGPAVIISFLIAAIASVFAGLCYAEFGARVPKAGSAYVYSYVSVGEFVAFLIGWNLILEYVIGSASVVKGLFTYIDELLGNVMANFFREIMPMELEGIAHYPDFFSLGVTILFALALAFGAKESSMVNNVFTVINLTVVLFVIISGLWKVDPDNWSVSKEDANNCTVVCGDKFGEGGFAPYGVSGIIRGAAACFYGFIGFDVIATAGEEAKTPQRSIPIAIVVSLLIIFLAYFGISTVLTMMLPYYEQDEDAPFPHLYETVGWIWAKYLVSVGAICGLFSSLLGAMFPLPRVIYAMSSDGLLFRFMGKVHPRFKTPFYGTILAGIFTGCLACIFELTQLFKMMSMGTLLAYSMVAACVLILRYHDGTTDKKNEDHQPVTFKEFVSQMINTKAKNPTNVSTFVATVEIFVYFLLCFVFGAIITFLDVEISEGNPYAISGLVIISAILILILVSINFQPLSQVKLTFQVPLVPWLPALSILINVYLMVNLDGNTWIRFAVWMAIGLAIYFFYGLWTSNEIIAAREKEELKSLDKNYNISQEKNQVKY